MLMSDVVSFEEKYDSVPLDEWVMTHPSDDDLRNVFLNMDRALKYIHDHGYCIQAFYPTEISVLNNEDDHIQFNKLVKLSSDFSTRKNMIKEDIFRSSLIQVGIYSNCLKNLNPDFLKENFDSFTQFIPSGDVPYYRGVIQRGASVYFCEYALEKRNRDLQDLEKQLGEEGSEEEKQLQLTQENTSITNDKINDSIYKQINGLKDAAFINALIIPTIILTIILVFAIISWVISMI